MTRASARDIARRVKYHHELHPEVCLCRVVTRAGLLEGPAKVTEQECLVAGQVVSSEDEFIDYMAALRGGAFDD